MFLYKLECSIAEHGQFTVFILANDDLSAFDLAEQLVHNQFVKPVKIEETVLVEKKPVRPGAGYAVLLAQEKDA